MHEETSIDKETILTYAAGIGIGYLTVHYGFKAYDAVRRRRHRQRAEREFLAVITVLENAAKTIEKNHL